MTKMFLRICLALVGLGLYMLPAHADQIYVCQPSTTQMCTSAPGGTAAGGESNLITNTGSFDIGNAGNHNQDNPLLVVIAVYNGAGTPTLSFDGSSVSLAATGTYGLTANMFNLTSGDVFGSLGVTSGGSISFGNFSGADTANGFAAPSSFELYVFAVPTSLTAGTPITLDESGAGGGSFILAYSCKSGETVDATCPHGDVGQTVFTNVGLVATTTPEPSSLILFGVGLLGLGGYGRRRLFS